MDLVFDNFDENVSGVDISISGLPYLQCKKCNLKILPDNSRHAIIHIHQQATEREKTAVKVKRNKSGQNFGFTDVQFIYDSDDYKYIPGLVRQPDDGFLTPVFFNREVLIKYDASPIYRLGFASTTYGEIMRGDDFAIPFGINKNGKVIMWLGDIAKLPVEEQYYLRSENVESDHSIGSEFYDGQIEVIFTDLSKENLLFKYRSYFLDAFFRRFGQKIAQLEREVYDFAIGFSGPVIDTEKERQHVADILNKIYIESFNKNALAKILRDLGGDPANLGSLKRLQKILEYVADTEEVYELFSPFFVLYDLRVAYSHLGSEDGREGKISSVKQRLNLPPEADFTTIYNTLIGALAAAFERLTKILAEPSA